MGVIMSRFRKKQSTIEVLEHIDKRITELQKFRYRNQQQKKQYTGSLILYSIILYILAGLLFYFYYLPDTWRKRLLYSTPLLIFPFIVWLLKKFLHWYFVKRIARNDLELGELRSKKKQILEEVMEKETYKKAKEILEKYDPDRFKKVEEKTIIISPKSTITPAGSALRQRSVGSRASTGTLGRGRGITPGHGQTPHLPQGRGTPIQPRQIMSAGRNGQPGISPYALPPGPPLPRPIPPRDRGKMDRLVEYFVGDGPQNSYALVCKFCHSHNGMALKEEFEYLSFRCCYCYQFNPARKQKPFAPKLDFAPPSTATPMSGNRGVTRRSAPPSNSGTPVLSISGRSQSLPSTNIDGMTGGTAAIKERLDAEEEEEEEDYSDEEDGEREGGQKDKKTEEHANREAVKTTTSTDRTERLDNLEESMDVTESVNSDPTGHHEANVGTRTTPSQVTSEIRLNGHSPEDLSGAAASDPVSNGKHS